MKKEIIIDISSQSELLKVLYEQLENLPRGKVKSYLEHRQVLVNGVVTTKFNHPLKAGDMVKIILNEGTKARCGLDIIYEDEYLLAVNKPAGLLTVATDSEKQRTAYAAISEMRRGDIFVVHRLDRDTSGVLLFAKSAKIRDALQKDWNERIVLREYLAICEGEFDKKKGRCDSLIVENRAHVMYSAREGKRAITDYEVISERSGFSFVRVNLQTGRKNQIRVHMKELGNPIVGDKKYGSSANPIGRMGLHASALGFVHPVTGKEVVIKAAPERKFALPKK